MCWLWLCRASGASPPSAHLPDTPHTTSTTRSPAERGAAPSDLLRAKVPTYKAAGTVASRFGFQGPGVPVPPAVENGVQETRLHFAGETDFGSSIASSTDVWWNNHRWYHFLVERSCSPECRGQMIGNRDYLQLCKRIKHVCLQELISE